MKMCVSECVCEDMCMWRCVCVCEDVSVCVCDMCEHMCHAMWRSKENFIELGFYFHLYLRFRGQTRLPDLQAPLLTGPSHRPLQLFKQAELSFEKTLFSESQDTHSSSGSS